MSKKRPVLQSDSEASDDSDNPDQVAVSQESYHYTFDTCNFIRKGPVVHLIALMMHARGTPEVKEYYSIVLNTRRRRLPCTNSLGS